MTDSPELSAAKTSTEKILNEIAIPQYRCGNCIFAWATPDHSQFLCRRFPPTVYQSEIDIKREPAENYLNGVKIVDVRQTLSQFPIVHEMNWCGEHKKSKGAAK